MGIDPNEPKDPQTKRITPLSIAISRGYSELAQYLCSKQALITVDMFYLACKYPDLNLLNFILE